MGKLKLGVKTSWIVSLNPGQSLKNKTHPTATCYFVGISILLLFQHHLVESQSVQTDHLNPSHIVKQNLTIGYLTAIKGSVPHRQGLTISGAILLAIEKVNNDSKLLPGVNLELKYGDTEGDTIKGTKILTDMLCEDVAAYFGPEISCYVEATVAAAWNRTMISYRCGDGTVSDKSKFPTFARTEAPDTQIVKSVLSVMHHHQWKTFSIIVEDPSPVLVASSTKSTQYTIVAEKLEQFATSVKNVKYRVANRTRFTDGNPNWYEIVTSTMNKTRIYVFIGQDKNLIEMMGTMQSLQLFQNGEYLVIFVDIMTYNRQYAFKYLWRHQDISHKINNCQDLPNFDPKLSRSLLIVAPSPPDQVYENFTADVNKYGERPPFNFGNTILSTKLGFNKAKEVSVYAANLYDAVIIYAHALHSLKEIRPHEDIQSLARDGRAILQEIIKMKAYTSITGAKISIDENGDSEGNYTLIAFKPMPKDKPFSRIMNANTTFTCPYYMVPVANFQPQPQHENITYPRMRLFTGQQIDWIGGKKPSDEPKCGFDGEKCTGPGQGYRSVITACVLGFVLFVVISVAASLYRKWKIEQEIEGLLWKIDENELVPQQPFGETGQSRISLVSVGSIGQVYCATATYKGAIVRIKELKLLKKHVISRQTMKEMRYIREMCHPNVNSFHGAVIGTMKITLAYDYCGKGSLSDVVENEDIRLDTTFVASLIHDLLKGMMYLHESDLGFHGNLKSSNCVITSRWVLQLTDFGLSELRAASNLASNDPTASHAYHQNMLWKAPELLRERGYVQGTQKGDVYAFAIILYEVYGRKGPYGMCEYDPQEIVDRVRDANVDTMDDTYFRPDIGYLEDCTTLCPDFVLTLMKECWDELPEARPSFRSIRERLKPLKEGMTPNIMDHMIGMMEKYANNLEDLVNERTGMLFQEKKKTEDLLHRMLPPPVAERLTLGEGIEPDSYDSVTIYFSDIVGFTQMSAESTPLEVVNFLNDLYTLFDSIIQGYDVYKVETIGDAYMVVSGLPIKNGTRHAGEICSMALDLLTAVHSYRIAHRPNDTLKLRIGIHTGPVCAGVVGITMPRYCLFGDTVNTSSRMESNGEALKIHISDECKQMLDRIGGYVVKERGLVHLKGKGDVRTWWLVGAAEGAVTSVTADMKDLKPLFCRPRGLQTLSEQQNLRRRASPKLPGSGNVSRQGSFCAGTASGPNSSHLTANNNKGSTNYLRRPSFDPALLSISLKAAQNASNSSNGNVQTSAAPTSRDSPCGTPTTKRKDQFSSNRLSQKHGECSVTIEPPSDSSTTHTPALSPLKTIGTICSPSSSHSLPPSSSNHKLQDLLTKKVAFNPKMRLTQGLMRESRSLDVLHSRESGRENMPCASPAVKMRRMSKSVDIDEGAVPHPSEVANKSSADRDSYPIQSEKSNRASGYTSSPKLQRATLPPNYSSFVSKENTKPNSKRPTYNKLYRNQKNFQNRSNDSFSCDSDDKNEAAYLLDPAYAFEGRSNQDEEDYGHLSQDDNEESHVSMRVNICESEPESEKLTRNPHWRKLSDQMEQGKQSGSGLKKWFQTILNGNGIGSSGSGAVRSSVPESVHSHSSINPKECDVVDVRSVVDTRQTSGPSDNFKPRRDKKKPSNVSSDRRSCDVPKLLENESVL